MCVSNQKKLNDLELIQVIKTKLIGKCSLKLIIQLSTIPCDLHFLSKFKLRTTCLISKFVTKTYNGE